MICDRCNVEMEPLGRRTKFEYTMDLYKCPNCKGEMGIILEIKNKHNRECGCCNEHDHPQYALRYTRSYWDGGFWEVFCKEPKKDIYKPRWIDI